MPKVKFDHVALLVRNLEQAVQDYEEIFSVLDSDISGIVWDEGLADGFRVRWATFVKSDGGTVLQFIQSDHPRDKKLLEKKGECVHHLAYCSTNVEQTAKSLIDAGIPITHSEPVSPPDKPWLKWTFIPPAKAHGVLIEVATQYKVKDGKWVKEEECS